MDKRNSEETKKAILEAARQLVCEYEDLNQVTAREITKRAGVNLAMINYCFGSKEALFYEVFEKMKEEAAKENPYFYEIIHSKRSPKEKLIELHVEATKFMLEHLSMCRAVMKYILLERPVDGDRGSLIYIMAHFNGKKSEGECRRIAFELSGLHELLILRAEELEEVCGVDLKDEKVVRKIVTEHVERYLPG